MMRFGLHTRGQPESGAAPACSSCYGLEALSCAPPARIGTWGYFFRRAARTECRVVAFGTHPVTRQGTVVAVMLLAAFQGTSASCTQIELCPLCRRHPDKNQSPEAKEVFQKKHAAYDRLVLNPHDSEDDLGDIFGFNFGFGRRRRGSDSDESEDEEVDFFAELFWDFLCVPQRALIVLCVICPDVCQVEHLGCRCMLKLLPGPVMQMLRSEQV